MKNITIYISTCDKTKGVLEPAIMLMEKYWPKEKTVKILGYNGEGIHLPENYSFVSMRPAQLSIDDWAKDIYSVIKNDPNEFVVFLLDDMLQLDYFNIAIFNMFIAKMTNDRRIIRADLGMDLQTMTHSEIATLGDFKLIEKSVKAGYWHTTQPSIWRKDYFLNLLQKSTNPWHFETGHRTPEGKREIGTKGRYAAKSMIETAISNLHPGKFNVMGMKFEDIKWLVSEKVIDPSKMQWGMRRGNIPQFSDYGFAFTMSHLKNYKDNIGFDLYNHYKTRYGDIYQ